MTWDDLFDAQRDSEWSDLPGDAEVVVRLSGQNYSAEAAFVENGQIVILANHP